MCTDSWHVNVFLSKKMYSGGSEFRYKHSFDLLFYLFHFFMFSNSVVYVNNDSMANTFGGSPYFKNP